MAQPLLYKLLIIFIDLVLQVAPDVILAGIVDHSTQYSFCMCNPPFYHDKEDQLGGASRSGHRPIPRTQNTGNEAETITKGGEVEFVRRIVVDSLTLGTSIRLSLIPFMIMLLSLKYI